MAYQKGMRDLFLLAVAFGVPFLAACAIAAIKKKRDEQWFNGTGVAIIILSAIAIFIVFAALGLWEEQLPPL